MQCKDAIRQAMGMADSIIGKYLEDLDDAAFLIRPVAGMNHIAWQMGHLISAERGTMEGIKPGSCPALPEGFDAKHGKETISLDDPKAFYTKDEYLALWKAQRAATQAHLGLCIEVTGHTDDSGTVTTNAVLRSVRAAVVARAFVDAGVPPALVEPRGADVTRGSSRRIVTFRAALRTDASHPGCPP